MSSQCFSANQTDYSRPESRLWDLLTETKCTRHQYKWLHHDHEGSRPVSHAASRSNRHCRHLCRRRFADIHRLQENVRKTQGTHTADGCHYRNFCQTNTLAWQKNRMVLSGSTTAASWQPPSSGLEWPSSNAEKEEEEEEWFHEGEIQPFSVSLVVFFFSATSKGVSIASSSVGLSYYITAYS